MGTTNIAWSLETSGQSALFHEVTATGFFRPATDSKRQQIALYLNPSDGAGELDEQSLSRTLRDRTGYTDLSVTLCTAERELLSGLNRFTNAMEFRTERLTTYNGEHWNGGFALPFIRTRCANHNIDWVFDETPHLDLTESIETHFNIKTLDLEALEEDALVDLAEHLGVARDYRRQTVDRKTLRTRIRDAEPTETELATWTQTQDIPVPTTARTTLVETHEALCGDECPVDFDPYQDTTTGSEQASSPEDALRDLALHTLADLVRVRDLSMRVNDYISQRYCNEVRL